MADITKLIRTYRANECLWNRKSPAYNNLALRESAWRRIAFMFNNFFTIDQLKSQIRKLKRYYAYERLAIEASLRKGYSYVPRYSFFKDLCFLPATKSRDAANEVERISAISPHSQSHSETRSKMRSDQISCIIEDDVLLNNSRERIPSVAVDFRTDPAYKSYKCKTSLNPEELQVDHEFDSHYSLETNLENRDEQIHTICKLTLNQPVEIKNRSYERVESGNDRWYPTEHCIECSKDKEDEDAWQNYVCTQDTCRIRGKTNRSRGDRKRIHAKSESTNNNQDECHCECECEEDDDDVGEGDSEHEISTSPSRWQHVGPSDNRNGSKSHSSRHADSSGYSTPSVRYENSGNSDPGGNWSHRRGDLRSNSLYSNWPGPKMCGQSRPKKYLARCKICSSKAKPYEKHCGGHWRRNNEVLCQRLNEELSNQKQTANVYPCGHKKQLKGSISKHSSYGHGQRRSSGAEGHSGPIDLNPYNQDCQQNCVQMPPAFPMRNFESNKFSFFSRKRKHRYKSTLEPPPMYMQPPPQRSEGYNPNCVCSENYEEPVIVPCPVHHHNFNYQQSQYQQIPPPPHTPDYSPVHHRNFDYQQPSQYPPPPPEEPEYPPDFGNPAQNTSPRQLAQLPGKLSHTPTPTSQSYTDAEPSKAVEEPKQYEELIENPEPMQTRTRHRHRDENGKRIEYVVCHSFKRDDNDGHLEYVVCPTYKRRYEREFNGERERESGRSRRRHHRHEPDEDNDVYYADYPAYKQRKANNYIAEREILSKYEDNREAPSRSRRRERDYDYVECPAYKKSRGKRIEEEEEFYNDQVNRGRKRRENENQASTGRSRARHEPEEEPYDEQENEEKQLREEQSCDEECPAFVTRKQDQKPKRSLSPDKGNKLKKEVKQNCEKRECPAVKRLRQQQTLKKTTEESKRRNKSQPITSRKGPPKNLKARVYETEIERNNSLECECESETDREQIDKRKPANHRTNQPTTSRKGPSKTLKGRANGKPERKIATEQDNSLECECESETDHEQRKPGKICMTNAAKNRKITLESQSFESIPKKTVNSDIDTELDEVKRKQKGGKEPYFRYKPPEMCEVAVETEIDMTLKGRRRSKPQNHHNQLDCCCPNDNLENSEHLLSCECDESDINGVVSQKTGYKSNGGSPQMTNNNILPHRSGAGHSNAINLGNKRRQRSGFEPLPKWIKGIGCQRPDPQSNKPIVLKSFLIPPIVAKATMGIINNHLCNFNQLLRDQQCLANKPVVRCLRKKPIPKPSHKSQLRDNQALMLTNNPFESINFNASKREVIVLHPPANDFRPSKNSFDMHDVEVKHLQVPNAEKEPEPKSRIPPTPPPTKPKRTIH